MVTEGQKHPKHETHGGASASHASSARLAERVSRLPVMGRALDVLSNAYDRYGKHSDIPLVRSGVNAVESRLHNKLVTVESLVCAGLDRIEDSAARLATTSSAFASSTRELPHTVAAKAAELVHDTRERAVGLVQGTRDMAAELVHETREAVSHPQQTVSAGVSAGVNAITSTALSVEHRLAAAANWGMDLASAVVDRVAPPAAPASEHDESSDSTTTLTKTTVPPTTSTNVEEQKEKEEEEVEGEDEGEEKQASPARLGDESRRLVSRVRSEAGKVRARLVHAALLGLQGARLRSADRVQQLQQHTVDLLQYAQSLPCVAAAAKLVDVETVFAFAHDGLQAASALPSALRHRANSAACTVRRRAVQVADDRHIALVIGLGVHSLDVTRPMWSLVAPAYIIRTFDSLAPHLRAYPPSSTPSAPHDHSSSSSSIHTTNTISYADAAANGAATNHPSSSSSSSAAPHISVTSPAHTADDDEEAHHATPDNRPLIALSPVRDTRVSPTTTSSTTTATPTDNHASPSHHAALSSPSASASAPSTTTTTTTTSAASHSPSTSPSGAVHGQGQGQGDAGRQRRRGGKQRRVGDEE